MRLLLLDVGGNFLDFALQCVASGHLVRWYIAPGKNGERLPIGDGLIEKVKEWEKWMGASDLIVTSDNTRYLFALEKYRKLGYPIFGCNVEGARMELERNVGQDVLKKSGVDILPYKTFSSYQDAEAYVMKTMKRYVCKPCADLAKEMTYVSKGPADMIYMLRKWRKQGAPKCEFILQEFCPGIEMAVGGWIGPHGWSGAGWLENFENKKLCSSDVGPNTGECGTIMKYVSKSKLADKLLIPFTEHLLKIGYTGYFDVAAIIAEDGSANFLEVTARLGWPCFQIQTALHENDPAQFMRDLLDGYDTLEVSDDIAVGVVCAQPDFPYNHEPREKNTGIPIYGDMAGNKNIHPAEIMLGNAPVQIGNKIVDMPNWVTCGNYILVATGTGRTVSNASKMAYETLKSLEIPNSILWRDDIGERLKHQLPKLQSNGYAKEFKY